MCVCVCVCVCVLCVMKNNLPYISLHFFYNIHTKKGLKKSLKLSYPSKKDPSNQVILLQGSKMEFTQGSYMEFTQILGTKKLREGVCATKIWVSDRVASIFEGKRVIQKAS